MVLRRPIAPPFVHHTVLLEQVRSDVRKQLERLGFMRSLVVVQLRASGGYRITLVSSEDASVAFIQSLGFSQGQAATIFDVMVEADMNEGVPSIVLEFNPIDGRLASFENLRFGSVL